MKSYPKNMSKSFNYKSVNRVNKNKKTETNLKKESIKHQITRLSGMIKEFKECAQKEVVDNQQLFELASELDQSEETQGIDVNRAGFLLGLSNSNEIKQ